MLTSAIVLIAACGDEFQSNGGTGSGAGPAGGPCTHVTDCTEPTDPCRDVSCQNNTCILNIKKDNTALPATMQEPADCKTVICIDGNVVNALDDNDAPMGNECKWFTCEESGPVENIASAGIDCGPDLKFTCNDAGTCTGCQGNFDCSPCGACCNYICDNEECIFQAEPVGAAPAAHQMPNDCALLQCDGNGNELSEHDPSDPPTDDTPSNCLEPVCIEDMPPGQGSVDDGNACENGGQSICCNGICCPLMTDSCMSMTCVPAMAN
jgi:hypothetical protein